MKFWTDKEYKDERGVIIVIRTENHTDNPKVNESMKYFGKGMVMVPTAAGKIPTEFEVELCAWSIAEAFQVFEEQMGEKAQAAADVEANRVIEQVEQEMKNKSQSIITPDQMMKNAQFDPNIRG